MKPFPHADSGQLLHRFNTTNCTGVCLCPQIKGTLHIYCKERRWACVHRGARAEHSGCGVQTEWSSGQPPLQQPTPACSHGKICMIYDLFILLGIPKLRMFVFNASGTVFTNAFGFWMLMKHIDFNAPLTIFQPRSMSCKKLLLWGPILIVKFAFVDSQKN